MFPQNILIIIIDEECDIRIDLFTYLRCIHEELCQDGKDFNGGKLSEYIAFALYHTVDMSY